MSKPLTKEEISIISTKMQDAGVDSADEGMAIWVALEQQDPNDVRRQYDLPIPDTVS